MGIEQQLIDLAVKMATRAAMNGVPLSGMVWIPPASATDNPLGVFVVKHYQPSTTETPPWDQ